MHRPTVGVLGGGLLLVGVLAMASDEPALAGACLRIGAVMSLLWLALPQMTGLPRYAWIPLVAGLVVVARWPKLVALVVVLIPVFWILKPRPAQRGP